jgi:hypothetical protein
MFLLGGDGVFPVAAGTTSFSTAVVCIGTTPLLAVVIETKAECQIITEKRADKKTHKPASLLLLLLLVDGCSCFLSCAGGPLRARLNFGWVFCFFFLGDGLDDRSSAAGCLLRCLLPDLVSDLSDLLAGLSSSCISPAVNTSSEK